MPLREGALQGDIEARSLTRVAPSPVTLRAVRWGAAIFLVLLVALIASSAQLRWDLAVDVAGKRRHLVQPTAVMIGDSHLSNGGSLWWGWRLRHDPLAVVNLAQGGLVLGQIAVSGGRAVAMRPANIVVSAGTNDILLGLTDRQRFAARYVDLVRELRSGGARVIVVSVPPARDPRNSAQARAFNLLLRPAVERAGAVYLDLWPTSVASGVMRPDLTQDGVHYVSGYYEIWAKLLRQRLI